MNLRDQINKILDEGSAEAVEKAKAILLEKAQKSDPESQFLLSDLIVEYGGDPKEALKWLRLSGENGSGRAAFYLSRLYDNDEFAPVEVLKSEVQPDSEESSRWLQKALQLNYFEALWEEAQMAEEMAEPYKAKELIARIMSLSAKDVIPDDEESLAAVQSNAEALLEDLKVQQEEEERIGRVVSQPEKAAPGELYNIGKAILHSDPENAKKLLQMAADQGLVPAKKLLQEIQ